VRIVDFEKALLTVLEIMVRYLGVSAQVSLCYRCKHCDYINVDNMVKCNVYGLTYAKLKCNYFEQVARIEQAGTTD
jgi:hypothetical protein